MTTAPPAPDFEPHQSGAPRPFEAFDSAVVGQTPLRAAITAAYRRPEPDCLPPLIEAATLAPTEAAAASALARRLVEALRRKGRPGGMEALVQEYALSSQEGVALMCLAEALLRIPDRDTRDALIRDKIGAGDWRAHLGHSPSLFVNAATWGLLVTGRLTAATGEAGLAASLARLLGRGGEPLIRKAVDLAMRMMGEQFVTGQTIDEALARSRRMERQGFRYSYDMLGEAAMTAADAAGYLRAYEGAIGAIGRAAAGRGVVDGPGISVKLSALHPRYGRAQRERVHSELLPRLRGLALLARRYDIGLNIDAEEADRLELSLDLLEALSLDPALAGWNGLGFVVQAYGKRCPFVIDWLIDLARRSDRRLMVRLVKGAYWDSEIKRAQVDGLEGFPVYTRKVHTDVSYLACARKLLAATEAVFPQFATHNAQTVAAIHAMAGPDFVRGRYEFQCLHGMGEPLYEEVVGPDKLDRPCRIYAPVGTHETLLAYLVRRLLENGANSSFVHRIADASVPVDELVADPVAMAGALSPVGAPHERIAHPRELYGPERRNSAGLDLSNEDRLATLAEGLRASAGMHWQAAPMLAIPGEAGVGESEPVLNPADDRDVVGFVRSAGPDDIDAAVAAATAAGPAWDAAGSPARAACLARAADELEKRQPMLVGLLVREAGKTIGAAVAEVREAVDFLRYYGSESLGVWPTTVARSPPPCGEGSGVGGPPPGPSVESSAPRPPPRSRSARLDPPHEGEGSAADGCPLGPVVCISPWNFPLAIFVGQVAAALAAGNPVLAKPAEQTPLVAAEAVRILYAAGVPPGALQLLPGAGAVGAALVGDARVRGVLFTGSTAVARLIRRQLAGRLGRDGQPVALVAETGGQNAMVVDSSALTEQVVADVLASAFDSAGQRCSALRILCLQEEVADRTLAMLEGAMRELGIGAPSRLSTDVGPVIDAQARDALQAHVEAMRRRGHAVVEMPLREAARSGTFVAPTLIAIDRVADVEHEVFGPVLHVLRYRREDLDRLIGDIDATGYGLTFGLHTRIDETAERVVGAVRAGNVYVNRNMVGAVVGVQPFGGGGLSGTGPKAGGPLYLSRLRAGAAAGVAAWATTTVDAIARLYADWLAAAGHEAEAETCRRQFADSPLGDERELAGPVGERNAYVLRPRGRIVALSSDASGCLVQLGAILATGNTAVLERDHPARPVLAGVPAEVAARILTVSDWRSTSDVRGVLFEGDELGLVALDRELADRPGPILSAQARRPSGEGAYSLAALLEERSISTNTAAAGGNASLMSIG